jgi:hypothetical protein
MSRRLNAGSGTAIYNHKLNLLIRSLFWRSNASYYIPLNNRIPKKPCANTLLSRQTPKYGQMSMAQDKHSAVLCYQWLGSWCSYSYMSMLAAVIARVWSASVCATCQPVSTVRICSVATAYSARSLCRSIANLSYSAGINTQSVLYSCVFRLASPAHTSSGCLALTGARISASGRLNAGSGTAISKLLYSSLGSYTGRMFSMSCFAGVSGLGLFSFCACLCSS